MPGRLISKVSMVGVNQNLTEEPKNRDSYQNQTNATIHASKSLPHVLTLGERPWPIASYMRTGM